MGPIQDIDLLALDKNAVQFEVLKPGQGAQLRAYKDLSSWSGINLASKTIDRNGEHCHAITGK